MGDCSASHVWSLERNGKSWNDALRCRWVSKHMSRTERSPSLPRKPHQIPIRIVQLPPWSLAIYPTISHYIPLYPIISHLHPTISLVSKWITQSSLQVIIVWQRWSRLHSAPNRGTGRHFWRRRRTLWWPWSCRFLSGGHTTGTDEDWMYVHHIFWPIV